MGDNKEDDVCHTHEPIHYYKDGVVTMEWVQIYYLDHCDEMMITLMMLVMVPGHSGMRNRHGSPPAVTLTQENRK